MKIIKPGKIKNFIFRGECRDCGCGFELTAKEAGKTIKGIDGEIIAFAKCPTCKFDEVRVIRYELEESSDDRST